MIFCGVCALFFRIGVIVLLLISLFCCYGFIRCFVIVLAIFMFKRGVIFSP